MDESPILPPLAGALRQAMLSLRRAFTTAGGRTATGDAVTATCRRVPFSSMFVIFKQFVLSFNYRYYMGTNDSYK
jgi:anaerobic glycerol-3-phosphate dehydrogenase